MKTKNNIIQMLKEKKEWLKIILNAEENTQTIETEIELLNNILEDDDVIYKQFEEELKKIPYKIFEYPKYRENVYKVNDKFKLALFKKHKILNCSKAEKCFTLAWKYGRAGGYSQIELFFDDFVELIK